jgi:hypothetical protein
MAIDKRKFLEMMRNPSRVRADELEDDSAPSSENPEESFSVPSQIKKGLESEFESEENEIDDSAEETKELDALQDDEPTKDEARESDGTEQQINNPDASLEMKKKAIAHTLKKYLGR